MPGQVEIVVVVVVPEVVEVVVEVEVPVVEDDELEDEEEDEELDEDDVDVVVVMVVVVEPPQNPGFRVAQAPLTLASVFCSTAKTQPWLSGPQSPPGVLGVQNPVTGSPCEQLCPQIGVSQ